MSSVRQTRDGLREVDVRSKLLPKRRFFTFDDGSTARACFKERDRLTEHACDMRQSHPNGCDHAPEPLSDWIQSRADQASRPTHPSRRIAKDAFGALGQSGLPRSASRVEPVPVRLERKSARETKSYVCNLTS